MNNKIQNTISCAKDRGISLTSFPALETTNTPELIDFLDESVGEDYDIPMKYPISYPSNLQCDEVVRSGQLRPKDRDYNKHGTKRVEQFEIRHDGLQNNLLTYSIKNLVIFFGEKQ